MPSFPPRSNPARQLRRLLESETILRDAIKKAHGLERLTKLAEKVRHYKLQVFKARKVIAQPAADSQRSENITAELANIEMETTRWEQIALLKILNHYGFREESLK